MNYIITPKNITIIFSDTDTQMITSDHKNFGRIREIVLSGAEDGKTVTRLKNLLTPLTKVKQQLATSIGKYDDLPKFMRKKIGKLLDQKLPIDSILNFWEKMKNNPNLESIDDLYAFLEANHFILCDDGDFIAYKKVNANYTDCHTGRIDNSPGTTVAMDRKSVVLDRKITCSFGLHAAGWSYMANFTGARTVEVKINPADVVSVPTDYNQSKMRCCKYVVVRDITNMSENERKRIWEEGTYTTPAKPEEVAAAVKKTKKVSKPTETTKYKVKRISKDRILLNKEIMSSAGFSAGNVLQFRFVGDPAIIEIRMVKKNVDYDCKVDADGHIRVAKTVLNDVFGPKRKTFTVEVFKMKIIIS